MGTWGVEIFDDDFALAALQIERDKLQPEIGQKVLKIIESGQGLARWGCLLG